MKGLFILILFLNSLFATNYALIIGCCQDYKSNEINSLYGTKNDVKAIYKSLKKVCKKRDIKTLTNTQATKNNILSSLKTLANKTKRGDVLYFYFSGHGAVAGDNKIFFEPIKGDRDRKKRLNKTALIPYNIDLSSKSSAYKSSIITSNSLVPIFKKLDNKGVKVVMFVDACFAGNSYRSADNELSKLFNEANKIEAPRVKSKKINYKNLIFFSASLNSIQAKEIVDEKGILRGEFTKYLEYCLKNADVNKNSKVTKRELINCLRDNFAGYSVEGSYYPLNRLNWVSIYSTKKEKIKPKIETISFEEKIQKKYNLKIKYKNSYAKIYKAGVLYAKIKKRYLRKYLKAYKLLSIKTSKKLDIEHKSLISKKIENAYCNREKIVIKPKKNIPKGYYLVALTLNSRGDVIILKLNNKAILGQVQSPFGVDRLKLYAFKSRKLYNKFNYLSNKNRGKLSSFEVEKLYKKLKKEKRLRGQEILIKTVSTDIKKCLKRR